MIHELVTGPEPEWARGLFPDQPIAFLRTPHPLIGPYVYIEIGRAKGKALTVICSARVEEDGKRWMHVSCSRPDQLPTWENLRLVKDTFIGPERTALQVLPPEAQYVNIHPRVLHLWSCIDGDVTPDFRLEDGQI